MGCSLSESVTPGSLASWQVGCHRLQVRAGGRIRSRRAEVLDAAAATASGEASAAAATAAAATAAAVVAAAPLLLLLRAHALRYVKEVHTRMLTTPLSSWSQNRWQDWKPSKHWKLLKPLDRI